MSVSEPVMSETAAQTVLSHQWTALHPYLQYISIMLEAC
jgi:hypothetical protein